MKLSARFLPLCTVFWVFFLVSSAQALEPMDKWEGNVDYAATGGTFMEDMCQATAFGCLTGRQDGQGDALTTKSSAKLIGIPEEANLLKAYFVWMGSVNPDTNVIDNTIEILPPQPAGSETDPIPIVGDVNDPSQFESIEFVDADAAGVDAVFKYFTFRVDITDAMKDHHENQGKELNGEYLVSGFDGAYVGEPYRLLTTALAGWSILLVYNLPNAEPKRIYYYTDFQMTRDSVTQLRPSGFRVPEDPEAKATFFIGEGDPAISGTGFLTHNEELRFNDILLYDTDPDNPNPEMTPCNEPDNVFNGTINAYLEENEHGCRINRYGIDLDTFSVSGALELGDTFANVTISAGQDQIITNFFVIAIKTKDPSFDIPEEPEKLASVSDGTYLYPGQEFMYIIRVQNCGEDVASNVYVRDELPLDVVDYIRGSTVLIRNGMEIPLDDTIDGFSPVMTEDGMFLAEEFFPGEDYKQQIELRCQVKTTANKEQIVKNTAEIISNDGNVFFTNGGKPVTHSIQEESLEAELTFSQGRSHNSSYRFVLPGEEKVTVLQLNLFVAGDEEDQVRINSLSFTPKEGETFDADLLTHGWLALDENNDGQLDDGDTLFGDSGTAWTGSALVFNNVEHLKEFRLSNRDDINLVLAVDIAEDAEADTQMQLELNSNRVSIDGLVRGLPVESRKVLIPDDATEATFEIADTTMPTGEIEADQSHELIDFRLTAVKAVNFASLSIQPKGTIYDPDDTLAYRLYEAVDGEKGTMIAEAEPQSDNEKLTFSVGKSLSAGQVYNMILEVEFSHMAKAGRFIYYEINEGDVDLGGSSLLGLPLVSNTFTIAGSSSGGDEDLDASESSDSGGDYDGSVTPGDVDEEKKKSSSGCHSTAAAHGLVLLLAILMASLMATRRERL